MSEKKEYMLMTVEQNSKEDSVKYKVRERIVSLITTVRASSSKEVLRIYLSVNAGVPLKEVTKKEVDEVMKEVEHDTDEEYGKVNDIIIWRREGEFEIYIGPARHENKRWSSNWL